MRKKNINKGIFKYLFSVIYIIKERFYHFIVLTAIFIFFIFINIKDVSNNHIKNILLNFFSITAEIISTPFNVLEHEISKIFHSFYSDELRSLKDENMKLKDKNHELLIVANENKHLKELLNFKVDNRFKNLTSSIVRTTMDFENASFVINIGKLSGVKPGSIVLNNQNLIGKVVEIARDYSLVQLINNRNAKTPIIFNTSREKGIIMGNGALNNTLKIFYCSNEDKVIDGELVITSGDGMIYPNGLIIGKVRKGNEIYISHEIDFDKLEYVNILVPEN